MVQIDGGAAESAAVADFNNDGRLDIVSAESWYEAPALDQAADPHHPGQQRLHRFLQRPADRRGRRRIHRRHPDRLLRAPDRLDEESRHRAAAPWTEHLIDAIGPTEFAFLVDLDNDGKADDLLPQFNTGLPRRR